MKITMKHKKLTKAADHLALVKESQEHIDFLDRSEKDILRMLKGRDIGTIECLLVRRVLPAAKRFAKLHIPNS